MGNFTTMATLQLTISANKKRRSVKGLQSFIYCDDNSALGKCRPVMYD